ncbi:MAG TPA: hypothetical protein VM510_08115 [Caulifigura sp.]|nr:hypothetical protein [Caulifigura sp.]
MRSIPAALTWEMMRRGCWPLAGAFIGALGLPMLIFAALQRDGALDPAAEGTLLMQVILTHVSLLALGAGTFAAVGAPSRMFTMPVSTPGIVLSHLIPSGILAAALWSVCVVVLNRVLPLEWPVSGPALFGAVVVPLVLATSWYSDKSVWLPVLLGVAAGAPFLWMKSRYGGMFSNPDHSWRQVSGSDCLVLTAMGASAYFIGLAGVARQRRQEPLRCPQFLEWLARAMDGRPAENLRFRSAEEAQLWLEWRSKGILLPGVMISFGLVAFAGWILFSRDTADLLQGVIGAGMILPLVSGIVGLVIGNYGPTDGNSVMGPWTASRPMTSQTLARVVLKTQFRAVAICTVLWQLALWSVSLIAGDSVHRHDLPPSSLAAANWFLPWVSASVGTLVCLTGRSNWIGIGFTVTALSTLVTGMLIRWVSGEMASVFFQGMAMALSIASLGGAVMSFMAAHRRGLVSSRVVAACGLVVAVVTPIVLWQLQQSAMLKFVPALLAIAVVGWCVAPFAMAPLAVAWNRNR